MHESEGCCFDVDFDLNGQYNPWIKDTTGTNNESNENECIF